MQKRILKQLKRGTALVAALALTVSGITVADVKAASKAPTLNKTKISLKAGKSKKVKIVKKKSVTVKKVTWNINSGKKVVKLAKKTKTYATIKALKKGSATVSAKIKVGKNTYTRKVKVTVTAKNPTPVNTKAPATDIPATDVPVITDAPDKSEEPVITDAPVKSEEPAITDAPVVTDEPDATATAAPTAPPKVTATPYPYITMQPDPTAVPDELDGVATEKSSWNDGYISALSGVYAGKKVKITLQVRERGVAEPSGNVYIKSNYNGYPTLATVALSTEWQTVEIEYRFNEFANENPCLYFDDENKGTVTEDMTMYIKDLNFEVLDEGDPLGGTALTKSGWHKGVIGSFVKDTHENKVVTISFKIREAGVENPSGTFCVQSNYSASYPVLKSDIPLTTDWTEVSFEYTVGTITDSYPSIYLNGDDITEDMEMFMTDFKIEVTGDGPAPEITPEPAEDDSNLTLTGYAALESGAGVFNFSSGTGYPSNFNISNYSSVTVNFKTYGSDGNVITAEDSSLGGKLCLNGTSLGDTYNYGYGDGLAIFYLNNIGRYGNTISDEGITSKTFDLTDDTSAADCITCQLGTGVTKVEIVSIVLNVS